MGGVDVQGKIVMWTTDVERPLRIASLLLHFLIGEAGAKSPLMSRWEADAEVLDEMLRRHASSQSPPILFYSHSVVKMEV